MPFIESQGRRIYVERHGQGPALLFLHGAGSNAATWWQQLPVFARSHTCLTMDIRCFGRSAAPLAEFSLEHFVADVLALLEAEGIERVAIAGQSLGGMIGLKFALTHPERVAAFASCDSSLALDHPVLLDILATRRIAQRATAVEERSLGPWFLAHHPDKAALYAQINHFNPSTHSIPGEAWGATLMSLMQPGRLIPMQALRRLSCPTLVLVGDGDPIVPLAVAQEVVALIPECELAVIGDAGHSSYFEQPEAFNRTLADFLARRARF